MEIAQSLLIQQDTIKKEQQQFINSAYAYLKELTQNYGVFNDGEYRFLVENKELLFENRDGIFWWDGEDLDGVDVFKTFVNIVDAIQHCGLETLINFNILHKEHRALTYRDYMYLRNDKGFGDNIEIEDVYTTYKAVGAKYFEENIANTMVDGIAHIIERSLQYESLGQYVAKNIDGYIDCSDCVIKLKK